VVVSRGGSAQEILPSFDGAKEGLWFFIERTEIEQELLLLLESEIRL
jgi:hypothetical protein